MATLHTTPFAGSWYPGNPAELTALLDGLCESSRQRTGPWTLPRPQAFVVPHAGLVYSGTVAASAYRHLRAARPERVYLLGFAHRGGVPGIAIPDLDAFQTPLGEIQVDRAAARSLLARGPFVSVDESRVCDHSVEIQLPFLQRAVPGVPVVPLYVGPLDNAHRREAALRLAEQFRLGDILLASSDLTHYGRSFGYLPFPPNSETGQRLAQMDGALIEAAGSLNPAMLLESIREFNSTVCGVQPVALLLETLSLLGEGDLFQETLDYQTSGDLTGDFQQSVSYASLGYFPADSFYADSAAREALLASARATLRHLSTTGERKPIPPSSTDPFLVRPAAVFVSLHVDKELYGCVGCRTANLPLAEAVPAMALSAALDDTRFRHRAGPPEAVDVEISILTPMKRIADWKSFRLGRDGACLEYESRCGLLLPQVAKHDAYTETTFLEALSRKTGLRPDAYSYAGARLSVFQAQVFGGPAAVEETRFGSRASQH